MGIAEDSGFEEVAVSQTAGSDLIPATQQLCAFAFADVDILARGFDLLLIDLRTHVVLLVDARTHLQRLRAADELVGELIIDTLLHDHAACSSASLTSGPEPAPESSVDREIDVCVVQNDDGVFPAHLQRARLKVSGGSLADHSSNFAGSGK